MPGIWDGSGRGRRAERRGCVLMSLGFVVAVIAMFLALGSVITNWIEDAQLLGR
jgi:hypothetical protein